MVVFILITIIVLLNGIALLKDIYLYPLTRYYLNENIPEADVLVTFGIRETLDDNGEEIKFVGTQKTKE